LKPARALGHGGQDLRLPPRKTNRTSEPGLVRSQRVPSGMGCKSSVFRHETRGIGLGSDSVPETHPDRAP